MWRLHREALDRPEDEDLAGLLRELHAHPAVEESWRQPDLSRPSPSVLSLGLRRGDQTLTFITTVTAFNAPQDVTLEELRIESYYPADETTAGLCREMADA